MQRAGGSLRRAPDPMPMLKECASLLKDLAGAGVEIDGKALMEIGTGRRLEMPFGMYLCGAASVVTLDLNPLLKEHLVLKSIAAMSAERSQILDCFAEVADRRDVDRRFDLLCSAQSLKDVLERTGIDYRAPSDATKPILSPASIDVQFSYTVFEHVPRSILVGILQECNRLLRPGGVAIHHIDPSDHFAHEDDSISFINFLRFSDREWHCLAGNRFAYHNRLRASEYEAIYREAGHEILQWKPVVDQRGHSLLQNGFPLDAKFQDRPPEDLATVVLRIVSRPTPVST